MEFSHINASGEANMVDVGGKQLIGTVSHSQWHHQDVAEHIAGDQNGRP